MLQNLGLLVLWIGHVTAPDLEEVQSRDCEINVRLDFAGKKPPVILAKNSTGQYELAQPSIRTGNGSYLSLKDKKILIACPGKRNSLSLGGKTKTMEAEASCKYIKRHNYFDIQGQEYQTDQVQCDKRVTPWEFVTQESCNGDGRLLLLGYMIENDFYGLIEVCHRLRDGMTYYSRHILDGSHFSRTGYVGKRKNDGGRPRFSVQNQALFHGFPPYKYFAGDVQQKLLTQVTGNPKVYNNRHNKFFSKGHLSPNADFLLNTWRDVTFLFANVQPQWQEINGKNWAKIEEAVRDHAISTGKKCDVITGTEGVLTLNSTKLYLDSTRQRLPIPEHYIKVLRETESKKCVAFISNNFPLRRPPKHKCEDLCLQYGWPDLKDFKKKGYVYCCSYEGVRTAFPKTLPAVECTGGTLENGMWKLSNWTTSGSSSTTTGSGSATIHSGLANSTDASRLHSNYGGRHTKMLLPVLTTALWVVPIV